MAGSARSDAESDAERVFLKTGPSPDLDFGGEHAEALAVKGRLKCPTNAERRITVPNR